MLVSTAAARGARAVLNLARPMRTQLLRRVQSAPARATPTAAPAATPAAGLAEPAAWSLATRKPRPKTRPKPPAAPDSGPPVSIPPNHHHLPVEGRHGHWLGARGESGWQTDHPGAQRITEGAPVVFKDGFPDFSPWAVQRLKFPWLTLTGEASDMMLADAAMAEQQGCERRAVTGLRREGRLLWHHCQDGQTMLLVPIDLHMHVPHTGGASMLRRLREKYAREAAESGFAATWEELPPAV